MRLVYFLASISAASLLLTQCAPLIEPVGALAAADLASVAVFGRGIGDLVYSGYTGRDCSIVRLEQGKSYCRPPDPLPASPPFCTRSLGTVDCWANSAVAPPHSHQVADGPNALTPEQQNNAAHHWPPF